MSKSHVELWKHSHCHIAALVCKKTTAQDLGRSLKPIKVSPNLRQAHHNLWNAITVTRYPICSPPSNLLMNCLDFCGKQVALFNIGFVNLQASRTSDLERWGHWGHCMALKFATWDHGRNKNHTIFIPSS